MHSRLMKFVFAVTALSVAASAFAIDGVKLKSMSPQQRAAYFLAEVAMKRMPPAAAPGGGLDTTPPVLTGFKLTAPADVAAPFAQITLDVTATDDLSGVWRYNMMLTGPHGQRIELAQAFTGVAIKNYSDHNATDVTAYMEPGVWTADSMFLYDTAGNYAFYDSTSLASLGNAQISLVNGKAKLVDFSLPTVKSGKVLTSVLSLSGHAKGTNQPPIVAADFGVADGGSGVQYVFATWCLLDQSSCFTSEQQQSVRGPRKLTMTTTTELYPSYPPGDYVLEYLDIVDFAGNYLDLQGSDFGGATDFSQYMPGGHTIIVKP